LIDEYQDFNALEDGFIELLSQRSPIVVAGDDDQALYSQLRQTSCDHIRSLYRGGDFEVFELPFCMRCPKVVVDAVNDVIARAQKLKN
jgi:superfamily I DNA/RNA helicase